MSRRWLRPRLRLADWFEIQLVKTGISPWELCAENFEAYGYHIELFLFSTSTANHSSANASRRERGTDMMTRC